MCVDATVAQSGARLFEAAEWDDYDVKCVHVPCAPPLPALSKPLVELLPSEEAIVSFCKAVDAFWSSPRNRQRHIAVVCLTGINVSGFLIVQYLIRSAKWAPERALSEFAAARPPGIYCPKMLSAILAGSPGARKPTPPTPPTWHKMPPQPKRPPPVPLFPAAPAVGTKRPAPSAKVLTEPPPAGAQPPPAAAQPPPGEKVAVSDGPPVTAALSAEHAALSAEHAALLCRVASRADAQQTALLWQACDAFVGGGRWTRGQALERAALPGLVSEAHLVTWKAQSARLFLLVHAGETWLLDRSGGAWRVGPLQWPRRDAAAGPGHTDGLLLQGDLVADRVGGAESEVYVYRFLAYDLLACGGRAVSTQPLHKRLALLGAEVIAPRKASDTSGEKLQVRQKDCFRLKHVPYLLRKLLPELTHAHCGLVFLQSNAPYGGPGSVAEWSPTSLSTAPGAEPPLTDTELVAWAERHFSGK